MYVKHKAISLEEGVTIQLAIIPIRGSTWITASSRILDMCVSRTRRTPCWTILPLAGGIISRVCRNWTPLNAGSCFLNVTRCSGFAKLFSGQIPFGLPLTIVFDLAFNLRFFLCLSVLLGKPHRSFVLPLLQPLAAANTSLVRPFNDLGEHLVLEFGKHSPALPGRDWRAGEHTRHHFALGERLLLSGSVLEPSPNSIACLEHSTAAVKPCFVSAVQHCNHPFARLGDLAHEKTLKPDGLVD